MFALVAAFLALPVSALAQGRGRDNGDGRWDRNDQRGDQNRNRDNNEWRRQQAERIRAEELRRQQERERAEESRRNQGRNNDEWRRNQGRNDDRWRNDNDRNRRGGDWNGGYGGSSFALRQTALNAGYNNGIEEGRKDRRRGDRFEFRDEGDYQSATEDYSSRLGDRELYRRYFREGFANGYRAGYNGY
jgi:hypothetical protein